MRAFVASGQPALWSLLSGPGQPATEERSFWLVEQSGVSGVIRSLWAWTTQVEGVEWTEDGALVTRNGGARERHFGREEGWDIELEVAGARSLIDLRGRRRPARTQAVELQPFEEPAEEFTVRSSDLRTPWYADAPDAERAAYARFSLGEAHYRRSEESWREAGRPTASVAMGATAREIVIDVHVTVDRPRFVPAGSLNPYDNEEADINGDGVQVYCVLGHNAGAWTIVPELPGDMARVRAIGGWGDLRPRDVKWRLVAGGYEVRLAIPCALAGKHTEHVQLDVLINVSGPGRERRRGQLVLSGGRGEFVYLRGDRHDPARMLHGSIRP